MLKITQCTQVPTGASDRRISARIRCRRAGSPSAVRRQVGAFAGMFPGNVVPALNAALATSKFIAGSPCFHPPPTLPAARKIRVPYNTPLCPSPLRAALPLYPWQLLSVGTNYYTPLPCARISFCLRGHGLYCRAPQRFSSSTTVRTSWARSLGNTRSASFAATTITSDMPTTATAISPRPVR